MKSESFTATILAGHKGLAFEIPFDPAERWDVELQPVANRRRGHPVQGSINGQSFSSVAVPRSKRFFVLITDEMRETAGVTVGDDIEVVLRPAASPKVKPARRTLSPARQRAAVERVRGICLALPETFEKLSHGTPTWFAGGRVFVGLDDHHHGADHLSIWCNAPEGAQHELVAADPGNFFIPPYVGKGGWIGVRIDRDLGWPSISAIIHEAYRVTMAKRRRTPRRQS